jgi:hypothetical protein
LEVRSDKEIIIDKSAAGITFGAVGPTAVVKLHTSLKNGILCKIATGDFIGDTLGKLGDALANLLGIDPEQAKKYIKIAIIVFAALFALKIYRLITGK